VIRDAIPILRRAGRIEFVIVSNEPGKQDQIGRAYKGAQTRHGLNVAGKRMPFGDVDVGECCSPMQPMRASISCPYTPSLSLLPRGTRDQ